VVADVVVGAHEPGVYECPRGYLANARSRQADDVAFGIDVDAFGRWVLR
jgi:hypothetical protein